MVLDLTEGYTHSCRVRDFVRALRRWEVKLRWDKRPSRESYKQLVCAGQSPFFLKSLQVNCSYSGSNLKEQNIKVVSWSLELSQCSNCLRPSNQRKMETWKRPRKERGLTHTFSLYLYATITPRLLTDCLEQVSVAWARTQVTAQSFAFPPPPPRSATTGVSDRGSLSTNVVIWGRLENWTSRHHVITEE